MCSDPGSKVSSLGIACGLDGDMGGIIVDEGN